jgi:hypothetical protein
MTEHEALAFIAALSQGSPQDTLSAREADYLLDEMGASDELRELVVADVVGGQYQCAECFPDGCGARAEEHNAIGREVRMDTGPVSDAWAGWVRKDRHASDAWDQPVSRIDLIHEIAKATKEVTVSLDEGIQVWLSGQGHRPHSDLDTIDLEHDLGLRDLTSPFGEEEL